MEIGDVDMLGDRFESPKSEENGREIDRSGGIPKGKMETNVRGSPLFFRCCGGSDHCPQKKPAGKMRRRKINRWIKGGRGKGITFNRITFNIDMCGGRRERSSEPEVPTRPFWAILSLPPPLLGGSSVTGPQPKRDERFSTPSESVSYFLAFPSGLFPRVSCQGK